MELVHENGLYACPRCDYRSSRQNNVVRHMARKLSCGVKALVCNQCKKMFEKKYDLERHQNGRRCQTAGKGPDVGQIRTSLVRYVVEDRFPAFDIREYIVEELERGPHNKAYLERVLYIYLRKATAIDAGLLVPLVLSMSDNSKLFVIGVLDTFLTNITETMKTGRTKECLMSRLKIMSRMMRGERPYVQELIV